jgi:hypothetical protein
MSNVKENIAVEAKLISPPTYLPMFEENLKMGAEYWLELSVNIYHSSCGNIWEKNVIDL